MRIAAGVAQFGAERVFVVAGEPGHDLLEMHRDVHGLFVEQFQEQEIVSVEPFQEIALELAALWMEPADDE